MSVYDQAANDANRYAAALRLIGQTADSRDAANNPSGALAAISRTAWRALGELRDSVASSSEEPE